MNDDQLQSLFEDDARAVPAVDAAFRLNVMEKVARRRLFVSWGVEAAAAMVFGLVMMALWPALEAVALRMGAINQSLVDPLSLIAFTLVAMGVVAYGAHYLSTLRIRRK